MPSLNETAPDASRNTRARFEQWAKNSACAANTVSAVLGVRIDQVAESLGYPTSFGQSPFAISRGLQFESWLLKDGAKVLNGALARQGLVPASGATLADLRLKLNGGAKIKSMDEALKESLALLHRAPRQREPLLVAGLTIRIPRGVMLPEATLIIDVLLLTPNEAAVEMRVGEIKVFPDRGGYTDAEEIATARAQAGVYHHALELLLASEGLSEQIALQAQGFLVFTWPGSNSPVVRGHEDLTYQSRRAQTGFDRLDQIAQDLLPDMDVTATDGAQAIELVKHAETSYGEKCWGFCDLAPRCQDHLARDAHPSLLGDEAASILAGPSLGRMLELLDGGEPVSPREESLVALLKPLDW